MEPREGVPESNGLSERARESAREFEREAERRGPGLVRELWEFLGYTRKWWLTPILVVLLLLGLLLLLGGTGVAPFIYTLF
jgi:hypothetical protein